MCVSAIGSKMSDSTQYTQKVTWMPRSDAGALTVQHMPVLCKWWRQHCARTGPQLRHSALWNDCRSASKWNSFDATYSPCACCMCIIWRQMTGPELQEVQCRHFNSMQCIVASDKLPGREHLLTLAVSRALPNCTTQMAKGMFQKSEVSNLPASLVNVKSVQYMMGPTAS